MAFAILFLTNFGQNCIFFQSGSTLQAMVDRAVFKENYELIGLQTKYYQTRLAHFPASLGIGIITRGTGVA